MRRGKDPCEREAARRKYGKAAFSDLHSIPCRHCCHLIVTSADHPDYWSMCLNWSSHPLVISSSDHHRRFDWPILWNNSLKIVISEAILQENHNFAWTTSGENNSVKFPLIAWAVSFRAFTPLEVIFCLAICSIWSRPRPCLPTVYTHQKRHPCRAL